MLMYSFQSSRLRASSQITMRKVDGWKTLSKVSSGQETIDVAA
jgi:putative transposase